MAITQKRVRYFSNLLAMNIHINAGNATGVGNYIDVGIL